MKITWIGHSCFRLEEDGYSIIIDPYGDGSVPGLAPVRECADEVRCSHGHGDHNAAESVTLNSEEKTSPFCITRLETFHDDQGGKLRGKNTMFVLECKSGKAAHLGDLGCDLTQDQIDAMKDLTVLLIPVGGHYTIDARKAAQITAQLKPRIVIPMHFRSEEDGFGYDVIGTVDAFTELFDENSIARPEGSVLDTDAAGPAQVVVLKPQNRQK